LESNVFFFIESLEKYFWENQLCRSNSEESISVSEDGDDFITVDNEISCDDNNLNVETEDDPNMSVLKICDDTPL